MCIRDSYLSRSHEEQPMNKATYKDLKDQHLNEMKAPNLPAGPISKEDFEKYAEEYLRSFDKRHGPRHYDNPTQFTAYPEIPPRGSIFKKRLINPFSQPEAPVGQSKINAVVETTEGAEEEIEHHLPDIPLTSAAMNSPEFGALQKEDPELRELARKAKTQDHETSGRFFFRDGVLMKKMPRQDNMEVDVVVLPEVLRKATMQHFHGTMPGTHTGNKRTLATIQRAYFWPHMVADIKAFTQSCPMCLYNKPYTIKKPSAHQTRPPTRPNELVSLDLVVNLPKSVDKMEHILTIICEFSKFAMAIPLPDKKGETVAKAFVEVA